MEVGRYDVSGDRRVRTRRQRGDTAIGGGGARSAGDDPYPGADPRPRRRRGRRRRPDPAGQPGRGVAGDRADVSVPGAGDGVRSRRTGGAGRRAPHRGAVVQLGARRDHPQRGPPPGSGTRRRGQRRRVDLRTARRVRQQPAVEVGALDPRRGRGPCSVSRGPARADPREGRGGGGGRGPDDGRSRRRPLRADRTRTAGPAGAGRPYRRGHGHRHPLRGGDPAGPRGRRMIRFMPRTGGSKRSLGLFRPSRGTNPARPPLPHG
uniref:ChaX protein n=1 Tax=Streptomyces chartreusis TaxID=1969 RepID=Q4R0L1_STRCX|nr:ChaX protein [Streptomyces chartreusis]